MPVPEEREFVERFGLFFEMAGGSRMAGRLFGWLLICDPAQQSITELAAALEVSKASISTVIRQMQQAGFVERVPVAGSRQHHYRLTAGGWPRIVQARMGFVEMGRELAEYGMRTLGGDRHALDGLRADPRLAKLFALGQPRVLDVPGPSRAALEDAARRVRGVELVVRDV